MNMIGAPKHVEKALEVGVDIICAQGGEGGGHTGDIATSILIPAVVDRCRGKKSPLTGQPVYVVAAGGIFDGRGLAMALSLGAQAVWVGTRFICAEEAGAPDAHKKSVVGAGFTDTIRTIVYTGRPLRILKNKFVEEWEEHRQKDIREYASQGTLPIVPLMTEKVEKGEISATQAQAHRPYLMGQAAAMVNDIQPASVIIETMVSQAITILRHVNNSIKSKL